MNLSHMENPIVVHLAQVLTGKVTTLSTTQKKQFNCPYKAKYVNVNYKQFIFHNNLQKMKPT